MSNQAKIKKFLDSVTNLKTSAIALSNLWEELHCDNDFEMEDMGCEKYPFDKSFDEIVTDICRWEEKQRELYTAINQNEVKG